MPPRSNPTARQERLGAELRKMRERAGFTARDAAAFLASNPMQMSHVESGRSGISEERVRRLADYYRCDDRAYVDALVEMANERGRGWWEEYRGILLNRQNDTPMDGLEELIVALHDIGEVLQRPSLARLVRIARAAEQVTEPLQSPGSMRQVAIAALVPVLAPATPGPGHLRR